MQEKKFILQGVPDGERCHSSQKAVGKGHEEDLKSESHIAGHRGRHSESQALTYGGVGSPRGHSMWRDPGISFNNANGAGRQHPGPPPRPQAPPGESDPDYSNWGAFLLGVVQRLSSFYTLFY